MIRLIALTFVALSVSAQSITVACGSAADASFSGGAKWNAANQPALASQAVPYNALRYSSPPGTPISYTFAVPPGAYSVSLRFLEPNVTAPGKRVFSAAINGTTVLPNLDLFVAAGLLVPLERTFPVLVTTGQLQIVLTPSVNNALISGIQLTAEATARLTSLTQCSGTGPGWDCAGLYHAQVVLPSGALLSIVGIAAEAPGTWTPVK